MPDRAATGIAGWPRDLIAALTAAVVVVVVELAARALTLAGLPAVVWPTIGVLVGLLVQAGRVGLRRSLLVAAGGSLALLVAFMELADLAVGIRAGLALGDVLLAAGAAWALHLFAGARLHRPAQALVLFGVATAMGVLTALANAVGLYVTPVLLDGSSWEGVRAFGFGTTLGVLCFTPLFLVSRWRPGPLSPRAIWLDLLLQVILVGFLAAVFLLPAELSTPVRGLQFMLIPVLGIVVLRASESIVVVDLALVAVTLSASTAWGRGPYSRHSGVTAESVIVTPGGQLFVAQMFLLATATALILVAAFVADLDWTRDLARAAESDARSSRGLIDQILDGAEGDLFVKQFDAQHDTFRYILVNPHFANGIGHAQHELIGKNDAALLDPDDAAVLDLQDREVFVLAETRTYRGALTIQGRRVHYSSVKFPLRDTSGAVTGVVGVAFDRSWEHDREQLLAQVFDESPVPTARLQWQGSSAGLVLDANLALARLLGVNRTALIGTDLRRHLVTGQQSGPLPFERIGQRSEHQFVRADGERGWVAVHGSVVEDGHLDAFAVVILEDITARRQAEAALAHRASHDTLTGLPNRNAVLEHLQRSLNQLSRRPGYVALLFCDLDGFKRLNDSYGHRFGDDVLIEVVRRLTAAVRRGDVVGRLGGDEFVIVCDELTSIAEASAVAERIRTALHGAMRLGSRDDVVTVSIGISVTEDADTVSGDLLRQADLAMYQAKERGRNLVVFYEPAFEKRVLAHVSVQREVRHALADHRVLIYTQPIFDLATGGMVAAEALVRLRTADGAVLPPADFIEVCEESGLVVPLGRRVFELALAEQARWRQAGRHLRMAVNVSPRQLTAGGFEDEVMAGLTLHDVDPTDVTVEVTEMAMVDATGPTLMSLRRLRERGVHVAIDDFGTGYSSLTSLRYLPADIIKIDRSFVAGLGATPEDDVIVAAVIDVSHRLGRTVIAEGVETAEQAASLRDLGCDFVQGFLYGRPVPPAELFGLSLPQQAPVPTWSAMQPDGAA